LLQDILTGLCLVLVFEGIMPFLSPGGYKTMIRRMLEVDESQMRLVGLSSMIVGVVLLGFIR